MRAASPWRLHPETALTRTAKGLLAWTSALARTGLCVVRGAPAAVGVVDRLAARIAEPVETLYGTVFDVRNEPVRAPVLEFDSYFHRNA